MRGGVYSQKYFRNELDRFSVNKRKRRRQRMAINDLSSQREGGVVVATEMVMVGAGMVVWWTSRAMAGCFDMQKTDFDAVRSGNTRFFKLMRNRKYGIDRKASHHRYQGHCNYFSEFLVQACSGLLFFKMAAGENRLLR